MSKHETTVGQFGRFAKQVDYVTNAERNGGGHAHDEKAVWKNRPGTSWRKPGYAGPLSEDERIDALQFYINPDAELLIDDNVLYEVAVENESRAFPRRVIFTGWFDTGKQGHEWPGDFEIVLHEKPLTWDAARSVIDTSSGKPHIRVHMCGLRRLSDRTRLRFRYRLKGKSGITVTLARSDGSLKLMTVVKNPQRDRWTETSVDFPVPTNNDGPPGLADEVHFLIDKNAELLVDDLLLYEPGDALRAE